MAVHTIGTLSKELGSIPIGNHRQHSLYTQIIRTPHCHGRTMQLDIVVYFNFSLSDLPRIAHNTRAESKDARAVKTIKGICSR